MSVSLSGALGTEQDSSWSWYRATTCELRQGRYRAQTPYNPEPDVTFFDRAGHTIPLKAMLEPSFRMPEWDYPWTESSGVGQKISVRVHLLNNPFVKTFNARRETRAREAVSKNKLARLVAQATAEALNEYHAQMG